MREYIVISFQDLQRLGKNYTVQALGGQRFTPQMFGDYARDVLHITPDEHGKLSIEATVIALQAENKALLIWHRPSTYKGV